MGIRWDRDFSNMSGQHLTFLSPYLRELWQGALFKEHLFIETEYLGGGGGGFLKTRSKCSSCLQYMRRGFDFGRAEKLKGLRKGKTQCLVAPSYCPGNMYKN
jgi:hypothetical protein